MREVNSETDIFFVKAILIARSSGIAETNRNNMLQLYIILSYEILILTSGTIKWGVGDYL